MNEARRKTPQRKPTTHGKFHNLCKWITTSTQEFFNGNQALHLSVYCICLRWIVNFPTSSSFSVLVLFGFNIFVHTLFYLFTLLLHVVYRFLAFSRMVIHLYASRLLPSTYKRLHVTFIVLILLAVLGPPEIYNLSQCWHV